jgi:3-methyladenine DNA glycosylase AlkD
MADLLEYEAYQGDVDWVKDIIKWILDPSTSDQEPVGKTKFVKTAKDGPITRLSAVGKSNPLVRKKSKEFYKSYNNSLDLKNLLLGLDYIYQNIDYTEAAMFVFYTLETFKSLYKKDGEAQNEIFDLINYRWIDKIDHWIPSDHLCIDGVRHIQVYRDKYVKEIGKWVESDHFWRQRLSVVIFIKHLKTSKVARDQAINNITQLLGNKNYYIRKSFPWVLREISKVEPDRIETYVRDNISYFNKTELREAVKALDELIQVELIDLYMSNK